MSNTPDTPDILIRKLCGAIHKAIDGAYPPNAMSALITVITHTICDFAEDMEGFEAALDDLKGMSVTLAETRFKSAVLCQHGQPSNTCEDCKIVVN